jgi:Arabinofuranosyltransferase A C terminal
VERRRPPNRLLPGSRSQNRLVAGRTRTLRLRKEDSNVGHSTAGSGAITAIDQPATTVEHNGWRRYLPSSVPAATLLAWPSTALLGYGILRMANVNPLTVQGVSLPLAVGVAGAVVLTGLAWRWDRLWLIGIAVGGYAGWATTTVLAALYGTPYGFGSLRGDAGRMSALVMHFSTTWHNTDAADPSLTAEYPPLYPMLVGRLSAMTGRQGWMLLGKAQAFLIGAVVVVAFLLWQRLVHPALALVIAVSFVPAQGEPSKANEILAMVVLVPWLLMTFCPPPGRRRLNAVAAGVLGGLTVPWFPNLLMVSLLGVAGMAGYGWWTSRERTRYLIHVALTAGIAFVLASWYLVPLLAAYHSGHPDVVADTYRSGTLAADPLQLLTTTGDLFNVLRVLGVLGTVLLIRRAWWAAPLTILLVGTQIVRVLVLVRFIETGHAFVLFYSRYLVSYLTLVAGLLVTARMILWMSRRAVVRETPELAIRPAVVVAVATFVSLLGFTSWTVWAPGPRGQADSATAGAGQLTYSTLAHAQLLPDGRRVHFSTKVTDPLFPTSSVVAAVRQVLGQHADPRVLCYDQRLFAFQPWRNWLPPSRTSSSALIRWDSRNAILGQLAKISDPAAFAAASDRTPFGSIDVFVLAPSAKGWTFDHVTFQNSQFTDAHFVRQRLSDGTLVVIRR